MSNADQLVLLAVVAAAAFVAGMGYANRQRQQQSTDGWMSTGDASMDWLVNWGGGWR